MMPGPTLDRLTFLVVDDCDHMRQLVCSILHALGGRSMRVATDGESAMKMLTAGPVDMVVTDWRMEPVDGLMLTRWIRMHRESPDPFLPLLMITAYSEQARVVEARDAGVTEFITKPFSAKTLATRIVRMVESPRPFVRTGSFFGPDRRRKQMPFPGQDRRQQVPVERPPLPFATHPATIVTA